MLPREKMLQTIKNGKCKLGIQDFEFQVKFVYQKSKIGKRAEIFIKSENCAEIFLYPDATFFSVRHELCHAKLFRMGFPLTNTKRDIELFPNQEHYMRIVVINEWYVNELQRQVFNEYYMNSDGVTPRSPPFLNLPTLPQEWFTKVHLRRILRIAKKKEHSTDK